MYEHLLWNHNKDGAVRKIIIIFLTAPLFQEYIANMTLLYYQGATLITSHLRHKLR